MKQTSIQKQDPSRHIGSLADQRAGHSGYIRMGASLSRLSSTAGAKGDDVTKPPPTPVIEPPYTGPWAEYQFVDVTVPVESDVTFSFTDAKMTSTLSSSVLPELTAMYRQGYGLASFCRLPTHATSTKRLFQPGAHVGYQAIFCR